MLILCRSNYKHQIILKWILFSFSGQSLTSSSFRLSLATSLSTSLALVMLPSMLSCFCFISFFTFVTLLFATTTFSSAVTYLSYNLNIKFLKKLYCYIIYTRIQKLYLNIKRIKNIHYLFLSMDNDYL